MARPVRWLMPASFAVLVATLAFMMLLIVMAAFGKQVPPGSRYLVVIVLAIGAAFGVGGLGGAAALKGKIPIPGVENHPVAVSLGGGVAAMVIVLLLGNVIVTGGGDGPDLSLESLRGLPTSTDPPRVMITATYQRFGLSEGQRLFLELCQDAGCRQTSTRNRVDDPINGNMLVFAQGQPRSIAAGRLVLVDRDGTRRGPIEEARW
ncbi:MAG TPA: hypothetical protein VGD94_14110 [Vicinamibacterales bacterium]